MTKFDIKIQDKPLSTKVVEDFITTPACGGLSLFIGKVRHLTNDRTVIRLEFEAYEAMAIKEMTKIAEFIRTAWPVERVAIHHRTGTLQIEDTAVIIGISSPHRQDAMNAVTYAIDTLKKTVPIWKKEVFNNGEVWVSAHP